MSKMRYFNNKFSKIAKRWRLCSCGAQLPLRFWWPEVAWFAQKWFFKRFMANSSFESNQLWRHFSDVIVITTPKTSPNLRHKIFLF